MASFNEVLDAHNMAAFAIEVISVQHALCDMYRLSRALTTLVLLDDNRVHCPTSGADTSGHICLHTCYMNKIAQYDGSCDTSSSVIEVSSLDINEHKLYIATGYSLTIQYRHQKKHKRERG